ncbi:hypothetical protein QBC39DRAFT_431229 [Podospora conica]|nr:hypothetical protein QBC39DRAFT_431229 [Schizothecium conicum]
MVVVAVAGGTGGLGRMMVDALVATGKHQVKILARKPNPAIEKELGVSVLAVNYDDVPGLTKTLEDNNIHTVISAITMMPIDGSTPKEVELIQAADASKTTKRLISSDWGIPYDEKKLAVWPSAVHNFNARDALNKTTNLEHTAIQVGFLIDYWTNPKIKSYLAPITAVIDIPANVAVIPGSGNTPVTFIHSADLAKMTVASLDLAKWDPIATAVGDNVTWNEFVRLVEEVRGTKIAVTYDSVEKLSKGEVTELPSHPQSYEHFPKEALQSILAAFGLWFEDGSIHMTPEKTLNQQLPEEVQPRKVKELLREAWGSN